MGYTKNYLLRLLEHCSDENFGQDAVEFAITIGRVKLTGDFQADLRTIMGEPGRPETGLYDELCELWRRECAVVEHNQLCELLHASALTPA